MAKTVMLNLFQHLIESNTYETLNRVQGDKKGVKTQSLRGEEKGEGWSYTLCALRYALSALLF